MRFMRGTPHNERDVASCQIGLNIRQTVIEKDVVAKIGMGKVRDRREINHQRQSQQIRNLYRQVHRVIIDAPLRALHPVDDALPSGIGIPRTPHRNPRVAGEFAKLFGRIRLHPSHDSVYEGPGKTVL